MQMTVELDITSNFTFLTGGSHPEEYMERAALLGIGAVAVADDEARHFLALRERLRQLGRSLVQQVTELSVCEFLRGPLTGTEGSGSPAGSDPAVPACQVAFPYGIDVKVPKSWCAGHSPVIRNPVSVSSCRKRSRSSSRLLSPG